MNSKQRKQRRRLAARVFEVLAEGLEEAAATGKSITPEDARRLAGDLRYMARAHCRARSQK